MPKYHTRYVKEHYIKRDIKRELYEAFIEWCGERSINICLEKALNILRGNVPLNISGNMHSDIQSKYSEEISRGNVPLNVRGNVTTNTAQQATTAVEGQHIGANIGGKSSSKHHIYCLNPQEVKKIKNFEAFKMWIDKNFTLHRWWREEDGRVCFETSKPVEVRKKELS
jgi:hypothetical protein